MGTPDIDCVIVGAGVVGLATATALARRGAEVLVLEAEVRPGEGISARNSGVIHAGLYYPPGSLKAWLCVQGRDRLYDYAAAHGIPHRRIGKLVIATSEAEVPALEALYARGLGNGVRLNWLDAAAVRAFEPELACVAAIDSPDTGIIDVAELVMALYGELEAFGGNLLCHNPVVRIGRAGGLLQVETEDGSRLSCRRLVNSAGLGATALAHATEGLDATQVPRLWYGAGHYYQSQRRVPFKRLVYPLPVPGALGVHLGFDLAGRARFGPDLRFLPRVDYAFDDSQRALFAAGIRSWWPALKDEDLSPDFVGIRPKLVGPGEANPDFKVQTEAEHGIPGLLNLFGIESPGLTATLALAEHLAGVMDGQPVGLPLGSAPAAAGPAVKPALP